MRRSYLTCLMVQRMTNTIELFVENSKATAMQEDSFRLNGTILQSIVLHNPCIYGICVLFFPIQTRGFFHPCDENEYQMLYGIASNWLSWRSRTLALYMNIVFNLLQILWRNHHLWLDWLAGIPRSFTHLDIVCSQKTHSEAKKGEVCLEWRGNIQALPLHGSFGVPMLPHLCGMLASQTNYISHLNQFKTLYCIVVNCPTCDVM